MNPARTAGQPCRQVIGVGACLQAISRQESPASRLLQFAWIRPQRGRLQRGVVSEEPVGEARQAPESRRGRASLDLFDRPHHRIAHFRRGEPYPPEFHAVRRRDVILRILAIARLSVGMSIADGSDMIAKIPSSMADCILEIIASRTESSLAFSSDDRAEKRMN